MIKAQTSIDGRIHRGHLYINPPQSFPYEGKEQKLYHHDYGIILIHITDVGVPQWVNDNQVKIKIWFFIKG